MGRPKKETIKKNAVVTVREMLKREAQEYAERELAELKARLAEEQETRRREAENKAELEREAARKAVEAKEAARAAAVARAAALREDRAKKDADNLKRLEREFVAFEKARATLADLLGATSLADGGGDGWARFYGLHLIQDDVIKVGQYLTDAVREIEDEIMKY